MSLFLRVFLQIILSYMETLIDILLILVLIGLASLPIILFMFYALIRRMHNDWTHFIAEYSVNIENKDKED